MKYNQRVEFDDDPETDFGIIAPFQQFNEMKRLFFALIIVLFMCSVVCAETVGLQWDASPDSRVTGYIVYWQEDGTTEEYHIDVGDALTIELPSYFEQGKTYDFWATAYDANGFESAPSNILTYTFPANMVPTEDVVPELVDTLDAPGGLNQI